MRGLVSALGVACAVLVTARPALAHDDSIPERYVFILPGVTFSPGFRACCTRARDGGFVDLGVEVSAHRFVRHDGVTFLNQLGYGSVMQVQLGGIDSGRYENPRDVGTNLRVALGGQGTFSLVGVQGGVMTRAGSDNYATSIGPFVGAFVSVAILSVGVQLDIPVASVGEATRMPILLTVPLTLKWYFPIEIR